MCLNNCCQRLKENIQAKVKILFARLTLGIEKYLSTEFTMAAVDSSDKMLWDMTSLG